MCGIVGFTHVNRGSNSARLRDATRALEHRGPDQHGAYESEHVSLGAVRLKIIDLQAGEQPMFSEDRRTVVVLNGEIYNHRELRVELEAAGHHFSTQCDTEVVLQAFLRWDVDCFRRLRGMFAVAFWQESRKRLVLARDRMGIKPLYVHHRGRDVCFGSELKALFVHPEIERRLDPIALQQYLSLNYVPCPRTLVEGIEKLPAGHFLEWWDGAVRTEAYWKLRFEVTENRSLDDASEELDALLKDSVREHLVSDVPLGLWLSGGVDSSSILHYASEASSTPIKTFSISFQGRTFDESKTIRETVQRYGTEHHQLDLSPEQDLPGAIADLTYYSDEPMADAGALPVWFLSRLSRECVTVALSGEGADELFGGYITYRADRLAQVARRVPNELRNGMLGMLRHWPVSNDKISLEYKMKRFLQGTFLSADEAHIYWNGPFSKTQQRDLLCEGTEAADYNLFCSSLPNGNSRSLLNRYLAFDQRYYLADDILQKVDRMSMAHSLEVRPPFLDHRVVEFAARLPEKFKIQGARQKVVLKNLMRGKLPAGVLRSPKNGLDIPTHDWLRGVLRPLLLETLNDEVLESTGIFRVNSVKHLIEAHMNRRANFGYQLWSLLILFLWIKQWNIQTGPMAEIEEKTLEQVSVLA
ncbi:MAG TPA: asparagine synthase (glutamine-hydrolyzing) [Candidatus Dormibacteraeota bacterium]|nr:asparagine synthase (glutamine-hydrolyzing) [Candidatus Dormibacteraeota bacterium]